MPSWKKLLLVSTLTLTPLPALAQEAGAKAGAKARTVELAVTERGFEPAEVKVKKGEPLRLVITRKTDATCATEIILDAPRLARDLPLHKPVELTFTPTKTGQLRYGCGMDKMIGGVLRVE